MKKFLLLLLLLLSSCAFTSCRTPRYIPMPSSHTRDSLHVSSDHRYDSIYIDRWHTLILRGDTVFRTDSIYVEKLRDIELHDTITVTTRDSIPYPIYIPSPSPSGERLQGVRLRFYRTCTIGFFLLLLCLILAIVVHTRP